MAHVVPLPPAAEQRRIVARLEELLSDLDAGMAELKIEQNDTRAIRYFWQRRSIVRLGEQCRCSLPRSG